MHNASRHPKLSTLLIGMRRTREASEKRSQHVLLSHIQVARGRIPRVRKDGRWTFLIIFRKVMRGNEPIS
jgi:hypothetical protein